MTAREKAENLYSEMRGSIDLSSRQISLIESALTEAKREGMLESKAIIEKLFDEANAKAQLNSLDGRPSDFDDGVRCGIRQVLRKLFFPIAAARLGKKDE